MMAAYIPGPRTPYQVTATRLVDHKRRDAELLDGTDLATIDTAIYLMECLDRAHALGVSLAVIRMSPTPKDDS